ncbi:uncharacterized protein LOC143224857 isoform X3 [Tachypleus tridentatus]|uniref:uncharacterized protein LOC143224857 isoform X3 n=1 Tax=Tachypleus tridentatus TaxID=6853 RepID=UPI003FCEEAAF
MEAFLKTAKSYLVHLNQFNGVHVVLGSKPCDLTSATATIVTAFFLNQIKPKTHHVVLPVINVSRKELRLRKEVTFLLEETDIPVNLLICKDEIDLEKLRNEGKLFLTLVDHNIISADQQFLENSVQVFHHHTYQAKDRGDRCDTTIEMVGSCCTLVAEKLLNISSDLDPQIVMLLYRAILLDTACLSEEARRATPKDVQIVAKLETFLEGVTRTEIFEKLKMFDLTGQPPTSQVSSAQNSCPHIPQNNSVDDTFHLQNIRVKQPNFLQSFKKQDMVEEVTKRVIEFGLETSEMKSLTFTAEESIVECSFDSNEPWRVSNVSSGELLTKMQDKDVALANIRKIDGVFQQSNNSINEVEKGNQALSELLTIGDKIEDAPDLGCANISSGEVLFEVFKSPATLEDVYKVQENQRNGFAHGEDMFSLMQMKPLKMDGTIAASENFVKNEPASDRETKLSSLLSEKVSPDNCDLEMVKDSGTEKKGQGKTDTVEECNQEIEHEDLGFDANSYQAETVDFPESPQHLKLLKQRTREAQEFGPDDDELTWSENRKGSVHSTDEQHSRRERPSSFSAVRKKKISVHPDILASDNDDDQRSFSSISNKSDADVMSPIDDFTPDDIDTPDDLDDSVLECTASELIPELSAAEEMYDERSWRTCTVGGEERKIDVKVIEPYKKVLSHGGYYGPNKNAIIVFSACYLPDRSRRDYDYVMDNLFLYVLSTLDQLIAEDYILVYLHGATQRSNMPSFGWLKRCYQMIDRRLRKNLKGLYLVHPTFWVKTIVIMTKPFISSKFSRKLQFVNNLKELSDLIPMDDVCIPDKVKQVEFENMIREKKRQLKNRKVGPGPDYKSQC